MLKVESNVDPDLSDPSADGSEHGIARWIPAVLRWWVRSDGVPASATRAPPRSPAESIPAMDRYLCSMEPLLRTSPPGDRRVMLAAAYRTSYKNVNAAGGVHAKCRAYSTRVAHYLKMYAPRGRK